MNSGSTSKFPYLSSAEIRVAVFIAAIAFFFSHGLPLWDDDYGKWLKQADEGLFNIIFRLLSPITSEPLTWGYSDRPGQVFIYKILNLFLGTWGTGYFFVKSSVLGILGALLFRWLGFLEVDKKISHVVLALLALSTSTVTTLLWHADFSIYSQCIAVGGLLYSFQWIHGSRWGSDVYEHGFAGIPHDLKKFLTTFFLLVYFGAKIKSDVRLLPVILLIYIYFNHREQFRVYLMPFGLTFLATAPWSSDFFKHLPPFIPGSTGYQGVTYSSFSVTRTLDMLFGPASVFSSFGYLAMSAVAIFTILLLMKAKQVLLKDRFSFLLIWFGVNLLACAILPIIHPSYQMRYVFLPLVPFILIAGVVFQNVIKFFSSQVWIRGLVFSICVFQGGWSLYGSYQQRMSLGHVITATGHLYEALGKDFPQSIALFAPNFKIYSYKETDVAASIKTRKTLNPGEDIRNYPVNNTLYITWNPSLDARFSLIKTASGCGSSLFDLIFPCGKTDGALLLKYLGDVPEVIQADQLDKQGKLIDAQQILEAYVKRDPGNHGAAFILSLYYDRSHNYSKMDEVYSQFGEYFYDHTSVLYNWGVAKSGLQKHKEAATLFERAYKITPRDLSIGLNLADSYFQTGKKARALSVLSDLQVAHPGNATVKDLIEKWSKL